MLWGMQGQGGWWEGNCVPRSTRGAQGGEATPATALEGGREGDVLSMAHKGDVQPRTVPSKMRPRGVLRTGICLIHPVVQG